MKAFLPSFWLTLLGLVIGTIIGWLLRRSRYRQTTRKLVETSSDESTKMSQFADGHASELASLRESHAGELTSVRADHAKVQALADEHRKEIDTYRNEAARLQGLVGTLQPLERKHAELEKTMAGERTAAQAERDRLVADWRGKFDAAEAARVKAAGELTAAQAERDRLVADWRGKFEASEKLVADERKAREAAVAQLRVEHDKVVSDWKAKADTAQQSHAKVQGLLDSSKADGDKTAADRERVVGEWRVKFENAEAARKRAVADVSAAKAEHDRVIADWRTRAETAEKARVALAAEFDTAAREHQNTIATWRTKVETSEKLVADERNKHESAAAAATTARDASLGQLRADHEKALAGLRTELEAASRKSVSDREAALRTEFESRVAKERGEHERILAEARSEHLRNSNTLKSQTDELNGRIVTLTGQHTKLQDAHDEQARYRKEHETELVRVRAELAEATAGPDDLLIIEGIGPKINIALNAAGIRRFVQVRDASEPELRAALESAGINFAPSITSWSKQAEYLASGDMDGFRAYADYLVAGQDPKLAPLEEGGIEIIPAGSAESGGIRLLASSQDDLTRIEGIGPVIDGALRTAGISTFAELSQSADERLRKALLDAGLRFAPSLGTWAEQARMLAEGDEAGFTRYTELLVAGRDPSQADR